MTTTAQARIGPDVFRRVMSHFPAGVAVVTAVDQRGTPRGLTTTAVTSVSMKPPLLLVCVDRSSRTLPAIRHAKGFVVNFLGDGHTEVALRFASKAEDKFAEIEWTPGDAGWPILHDHVTAWAECHTRQEIEAGDHVIFVGEVVSGNSAEGRTSLVYYRKGFGRWAPRNATVSEEA